LILACGGLKYETEKIAWNSDFHDEPPEQIFEEVTGHKVTDDVVQLRAVGRHYSTKRWAWLSFRASRKTIDQIMVPQNPVTSAQMAKAMSGTGCSANHKFDRQDKQEVQWDGTSRILMPAFGRLILGSQVRGWQGDVIYDHDNDMAYIHAGAD
jgi:hypothetical protein